MTLISFTKSEDTWTQNNLLGGFSQENTCLQHHILTWTPTHISTHKIKTISVMLSRLDGLQPGVNFFSLEHAHTVSGETWGSVGCLGWARRCSSYRSRDASGRDWQDCLGAGHDWFAWSADSKPHPLMASSLDRSAGFPGWLAQGQTQPPSPAASWKSSGPHPAGWCNPFLFALRETEMGKVNLQPRYWTCSVALSNQLFYNWAHLNSFNVFKV